MMMGRIKDMRAQAHSPKITTTDWHHKKFGFQESKINMPTIVEPTCVLAAAMLVVMISLVCLVGKVSTSKVLALSIGICL